MTLRMTVTQDARGIHFVDGESGYGLHFHDADHVRSFLAQRNGETWEHAFREVIRDIGTHHPEFNVPITDKEFTVAVAVQSQWP